MTLFLDSANVDHIKELSCWGVYSGITTNPSIMLKSGSTKSYIETISDIINVLPSYVNHLSVELVSCVGKDLDAETLINEAKVLHDLSPEDIVIKVPMYPNGVGLEVIHELEYKYEISTNATCLMSFSQVILATNAGASYASLFYNRIKDYFKNKLAPFNNIAKNANSLKYEKLENQIKSIKINNVTEQSAAEYAFEHIKWSRGYVDRHSYNTNLICGSIRNPRDVSDCFIAGADTVTVPYDIMKKLPQHPKTDEAIAEFDKSYTDYTKRVQ